MKKILLTLTILTLLIGGKTFAQDTFKYRVVLNPITVAGLPGLHSYAFAQSNGMLLIVGGRTDGLHARQPFNAFPAAQNNTDIYVVDIKNGMSWSASISSLPTALAEQLQSTNMNFCQLEDTLYIAGGYGYSTTATDHVTYPNLTTVQVSSLIQAIKSNSSINAYFKQMTDTVFTVTGGHLAVLDGKFYLVGGHKFMGRYNPMGNPTYTQNYTNQIRMFKIHNSGTQPTISDYSAITDPVHLRRRDYNLLPQIFPDRTEGFMISSGVFQQNVDLPFLYPVDIKQGTHTPITSFNQYLSNYHSANVSIYDSIANTMHHLFFGGMSQYYYQNGNQVKDDNVPFVNTISRLARRADGSLKEYKMPTEMPGLKGSSAEFILNKSLAHYSSDIIKMNQFSTDTLNIGHIVGGISSTSSNPFINNQTSNTTAENTVYEVLLVRDIYAAVDMIHGEHDYNVEVYPNPSRNQFFLKLSNIDFDNAGYQLTSLDGRLIQSGDFTPREVRDGKFELHIKNNISPQILLLTVNFDNVYFVTKQIVQE